LAPLRAPQLPETGAANSASPRKRLEPLMMSAEAEQRAVLSSGSSSLAAVVPSSDDPAFTEADAPPQASPPPLASSQRLNPLLAGLLKAAAAAKQLLTGGRPSTSSGSAPQMAAAAAAAATPIPPQGMDEPDSSPRSLQRQLSKLLQMTAEFAKEVESGGDGDDAVGASGSGAPPLPPRGPGPAGEPAQEEKGGAPRVRRMRLATAAAANKWASSPLKLALPGAAGRHHAGWDEELGSFSSGSADAGVAARRAAIYRAATGAVLGLLADMQRMLLQLRRLQARALRTHAPALRLMRGRTRAHACRRSVRLLL
jgi:hypothetical protein